MKGGNEATNGSGITQFADRRTKTPDVGKTNAAAENLSGSRAKLAKKSSRKVRKEMKGGNGVRAANVVTLP
ncbi:MAG: hypothetical protein IJQ39_10240 [Thermoguttaceae bacterium]|nr:hypothetical protein [Thermoguttaceae bacterium]